MSILSLSGVSLHFGPKTILEDASLALEAGERLGVVGLNGSGKSCLLKILAGQLSVDGGLIQRAKGIRVGYLAQEHGDLGDQPLLDSLMVQAPGRQALEEELEALHDELAATRDTDSQMQLSERLVELSDELNHLDQHFAPHQARRILTGLGFSNEVHDQPLSAFSGGWRMRAALAALLFARPDVMLLDEPTNHLDLPSVSWLGLFLRRSRRAIVLTCHDRSFLNPQITRVAAFESDGLHLYRGNYEAYLEQRELDQAFLENQARKNAQKRAQLQGFVDRFKAKATKARQAGSKAKQIEKLEAEMPESLQIRRAMGIRFAPVRPSAEQVLSIEGLNFGYPGAPLLFQDLKLGLRRGERVALVGVNGAGKTTLLKLVAGELQASQGRIDLGQRVTARYFAQHHSENLNAGATVIEEVWRAAPELSQTEARGLAGAFLFSGDDVDKSVSVLSGGEKARVALARLLASPGNFLLLDEPTNHLDTEAADALIASLESYDGSMLFVSHNLDFAKRLSNQVWDVEAGQVRVYPGTLGEYLEHLERRQALELDPSEPGESEAPEKPALPSDKAARIQARADEKKAEAERRRTHRKLSEEVAKTEALMAKLEAEAAELTEKLAAPDPAELAELARAYERCQTAMESAMARWESAAAALEAL